MTTHNLTGKVALIQGGSRGIGAAIVKRLAAQGAAVAFTYVSSAAKAETLQNEVIGAGGRLWRFTPTAPMPRRFARRSTPRSRRLDAWISW